MVRSFFGAQQGDFSITLKSISAVCKAPPPITPSRSPTNKDVDVRHLEDGTASSEPTPPTTGLGSLRRNVAMLINVRGRGSRDDGWESLFTDD